MDGEVDGHGEKCPGQHHAFHRDVDDTRTLRDHPAQGRQQQQRRVLQGRVPEVGRPHEPENISEKVHAVSLSSPASSTSASRATAAAAASASGIAGARPSDGRRSLNSRRKFAAIEKRISACKTKTRLPDTPASLCITLPPAWSAPNKIAARTLPLARVNPSRATAMASKPVVSVKDWSVRLASTPAIC